MTTVTAPAASARHSQPAAERAETYTFAFHDADIAQVAEAILGNALGLNYTVDPSITGKMSFRIDRRMTDAQLLEAFEGALAADQIVLVRQGDSVALTPRAKAKGLGPLRPAGEAAHGAGYQTVTVPLAYAAPSEVAKALQSVSANDPVVYVDDKQGILILGGEASELEAAVQLVHTFDHSGLEASKIRFFELEQAPAETVAGDLNHVLQASGVFGVTVVPLKRMNGLFVFARTSQAIDIVGEWIAKLDVPSKETGASLWVYHPRNASAEALASTLSSLLSTGTGEGAVGPGSGPIARNASTPSFAMSMNASPLGGSGFTPAQVAPTPGAGSSSDGPSGPTSFSGSMGDDPIHVSADKDSNTLLVMAPPNRWLQINKMLDDIDHAPDQVLIEASILEVTLSDQFNLGVDWSVIGFGGRLGAQSVNNSTGKVSASTPGLSVTFMDKGIQAAVNALSAQTSVEVLSAPKILALNNKVAKLEVGDQVPIITQTAQNTITNISPIVNSVDYRNTGVILSVTPRISGDDRVFLDVDQEVSSVAQTTTSGIDSPTIQQRNLQTQLILNDGAVVALGGLIRNERDVGDTGTPFVKDIPLLGNLFKTTSHKTARTELIVLISAKIIRDAPGAQRVVTDLLADMHEAERRGLLKSIQH